MTRIILPLILAAIACQSQALPAATPAPTVQAPARYVQRVTPTAQALHTCEVTATSLTVRECGDVTCLAVDWLTQGEVITTTQVISGWVWTGAGFINSSYCKEVK